VPGVDGGADAGVDGAGTDGNVDGNVDGSQVDGAPDATDAAATDALADASSPPDGGSQPDAAPRIVGRLSGGGCACDLPGAGGSGHVFSILVLGALALRSRRRRRE
jgi:hypothetical protein